MLFELTEYALHSFLHSRTVTSVIGVHTKHHDKHLSKKSYLYNPKKLIISSIQEALSLLLFVSSFAGSHGACACYFSWSLLTYNTAHLLSHTFVWPALTEYHRVHHMCPSSNRGVSSPVCDYMFGTMHKNFYVNHPLALLLPAPLPFFFIRRREYPLAFLINRTT